MLSDDYDLGMPASSLPACLRVTNNTPVDVDYARYGLLVSDVGTKVLMHHDTLVHQPPQLRSMKVPPNTKPLYLTRGPGVTYVLITANTQGSTTLEDEVRNARNAILDVLREKAPSMTIRQPLRRDLMSRSHQTVSGMLLNRVLTRLGYKIVWHVQWGMKCPVEDLAALDDAAKRARDNMPEAWNHPSLSNVFDVAATLRTSKIPVVTCWPTCHGGTGDMLAQVGATPMRCYPQVPRLFHRPFGSTQRRDDTPWPNIVRFTLCGKPNDVRPRSTVRGRPARNHRDHIEVRRVAATSKTLESE